MGQVALAQVREAEKEKERSHDQDRDLEQKEGARGDREGAAPVGTLMGATGTHCDESDWDSDGDADCANKGHRQPITLMGNELSSVNLARCDVDVDLDVSDDAIDELISMCEQGKLGVTMMG